MTTTTSAPAWARGHDVADLKRITRLFADHDAGMVHGAFGRYSELDAVADLGADRLRLHDGGDAALVLRKLQVSQPVRDFTGAVATRMEPGTCVAQRMAWRSTAGREWVEDQLDRLADAAWVWQEHPGERQLVHGWQRAAVKISAASEMRGLYYCDVYSVVDGVAPADEAALRQLPIRVPEDMRQAVLDTYVGTTYADHYSSYNKGGAWSALALAGFWPDDPTRIEKPAEMNKRWKAEHPGALALRAARTTAWRPIVEMVLSLLPVTTFERVRLMRLAPGGGELTRHADITDPDAGTGPGKLARLHIPLVTNPECVFTSWNLDGRQQGLHMVPGGVYYLDTRKPHTAINAGATERIHLVADCSVTDTLRAMLAGEPA